MIKNLSNTLKKKNNKKGFTLIELIVVIAILAILAAIAIPRFAGFQDNANEKAALAESKVVYSSLVALEAGGKTIDSSIDEKNKDLLKLTGPLTGTLKVTDADTFTYTVKGYAVTYSDGSPNATPSN